MGNQESVQMGDCMMDISNEEDIILNRAVDMDLTLDDQPPIAPLIILPAQQPARTLELSISFNEESLEHKRDNNPYEHLFVQNDDDIYPPMNDEDDHLWDYPPEAEDDEHGFDAYFEE
jgi:hypothetical protein